VCCRNNPAAYRNYFTVRCIFPSCLLIDMATPSKPPSTPTSSISRKNHIQVDANDIVKELTDLDYYLGIPNLSSKVEWFASGRSGNQLVKKQSLTQGTEEAVLLVIGQISFDDFWLLPLGGWTPGNHFNEPIVKARARCRLIRLNNNRQLQRVYSDWPMYLENLETLQNVGWGIKLKDGMEKVNYVVNGTISLTHYLFDVSLTLIHIDFKFISL
jgi:hypothetical protein